MAEFMLYLMNAKCNGVINHSFFLYVILRIDKGFHRVTGCAYRLFFFFFSTGLVRLYIAGLPLRSCWTTGPPSVCVCVWGGGGGGGGLSVSIFVSGHSRI